MGPMDTGCPCAREPHLTSWSVLWLDALAIVVGHRLVWHSNKWATPWKPEKMPASAGGCGDGCGGGLHLAFGQFGRPRIANRPGDPAAHPHPGGAVVGAGGYRSEER